MSEAGGDDDDVVGDSGVGGEFHDPGGRRGSE